MRIFEVKYTVYLDEGLTKSTPELNWLTSVVTAVNYQSAQAMIEAQYRGWVNIHSVVEQFNG